MNPPKIVLVEESLKKNAGGYVGRQAEMMRERWRMPDTLTTSEFVTGSQAAQMIGPGQVSYLGEGSRNIHMSMVQQH